MSSSNLVRIAYVKESSYGETPTGVKALLEVQDLTYTALKAGTQGNDISIEYLDTGVAGSEVVTVTGNKISVSMDSATSTATQIHTAILASDDAVALVTCTVTGTGSDAQTAAANTHLATGVGEFRTARFISEAYSGTPETAASQQIRTDRMSSGQVVTGLTVQGTHSFELAKETAVEDMMESAMYNSWDVMDLITRDMTIDIDGLTITAVTGSFVNDGLKVGDFVDLANFTDAENNKTVMLTSVTDLVLEFNGPAGMKDGAGTGTTLQRADKLTIGTSKKSLSIEKCFLDLTEKAINYKGMIANTMDLTVEYGSLIKGSFGFSGNGYEAVEDEDDFLTAAHYITAPETSNTLNGSVDMPFLSTDVGGEFATDSFCIQSLAVNMSNNLNPQNCIGRIEAEDYTPGTAAITVKLSSYLKNANWDLLAKKLSQESFAIGFQVSNADGWYAFYLPALQVSFDDPSSSGANQDISMDMSGTAKVGDDGGSALTIFRASTNT